MKYLIIWILLLAGTGLFLNVAYSEGTRDRTAILLAQTCVAEIGLQANVDECILMWAINDRNARAKNRSIYRQTMLFNSYWKAPTHQARRPYIKHMKDDKKPKMWGSGMDWNEYRALWLEYLKASRKFVSNPRIGDQYCPLAIDYGGFGDHPIDKNLVRIKCLNGRTRQRYWANKAEVEKAKYPFSTRLAR